MAIDYNENDIAIIGGGNHSKVVINMIEKENKYNILGVYDDNESLQYDIKLLGKIIDIDAKIPNFVCAIGDNKIRRKIVGMYPDLHWVNIIDPTAIISKNVKIGIGCMVCAGVIIQPFAEVNNHCILNTNCSIDHDCQIGDFVHIAPGATLCGTDKIGDDTLVGAGSTIIQDINVGENAIIGAGSVIIKDILPNSKIVGNPGRIIN